jgi:hypothetical protein
VRKLYSGFPPALPGVGLVILRVVLALSMAQDAWRAWYAFDRSGHGASLAYSSALIVLCLPVAVGFLAHIVHVIVALVESTEVIHRIAILGPSLLIDGVLDAPILQIAIAAALALLGPGAFSVDGRLFGRHEIIIHSRGSSPPAPQARTRK